MNDTARGQDSAGVLHEVDPVCVLDFYVHESKQRSGCGRILFEAMLKVWLCVRVPTDTGGGE